MSFVLDIQVWKPEHVSEIGGLNQRSASFTQSQGGVGVVDGEEFAITPKIEGAIGEFGRECFFDLVQVIFRFAPLTIALRTLDGVGFEWRGMAAIETPDDK